MTVLPNEPHTPELDKLTAIQDEYKTVCRFVDWLVTHRDYNVAHYNRCYHWAESLSDIPECAGRDPDCPALDHQDHRLTALMPIVPITADETSELILEFFELGGRAIDRERNAILSRLHKQTTGI